MGEPQHPETFSEYLGCFLLNVFALVAVGIACVVVFPLWLLDRTLTLLGWCRLGIRKMLATPLYFLITRSFEPKERIDVELTDADCVGGTLRRGELPKFGSPYPNPDRSVSASEGVRRKTTREKLWEGGAEEEACSEGAESGSSAVPPQADQV
jgi:hypothetical protein